MRNRTAEMCASIHVGFFPAALRQVSAKARARAIPAVAEAARRLGQGVEGLLERVFVGRRVVRHSIKKKSALKFKFHFVIKFSSFTIEF